MKERRMLYLLQQAFNKLQLQLCWLHTGDCCFNSPIKCLQKNACVCILKQLNQ
jgi:hypothetical protein